MKKNLFRQTTVEGNFKEYVYTYFDVIHVIKVIFPSTSGFNSSHKKVIETSGLLIWIGTHLYFIPQKSF